MQFAWRAGDAGSLDADRRGRFGHVSRINNVPWELVPVVGAALGCKQELASN
jgi:hypothetical protein